MDKKELTYAIKMKALELGFSKVGITNADDFTDYIEEITDNPDYTPWLDFDLSFHVAQGAKPKNIFPNAKSIICTVYGYGDIVYPESISQYVGYSYLSRCYNPLKTSSCGIRVEAFKDYLIETGFGLYTGEIAVPARRACARAGIVDFGKNNFAYTDNEGSFIILHTFLVNTELEYDTPTTKSKCMLFSNMSPMEIPNDIRENMGTHIHGCDICQKACPRNKKILNNASRKDYFLEELDKQFDIEKVLLMDEKYYKYIIYPIMHNYIKDINYFRRNVAIAMGNSGNKTYIQTLKKVLNNEMSRFVTQRNGLLIS